MVIALDFDGTLVTHDYPRVGRDIGAGPWLVACQDLGARFILFTMRDGEHLADAVRYCKNNLGLTLYGVNTNPTQKHWTMSPKAYAQVYVDDCGLNIPLEHRPGEISPNVDWSVVGPMLLDLVRKNCSEVNPIQDSYRFK